MSNVKMLTVVDGEPVEVGRCHPGQARFLIKKGLASWRDGKLWISQPVPMAPEPTFRITEWTEDMTLAGESWAVHRIHMTEEVPAIFFEVPPGRSVIADERGRPIVPKPRRIILPWFAAVGRSRGGAADEPTTPEERCARIITHAREAGFDTSGPFHRGFVVWITAGPTHPETKRPSAPPLKHSMGHLPYRVTAQDMRLLLPLHLARVDLSNGFKDRTFAAPGWEPFLGTNVHEVAGPVYVLRETGAGQADPCEGRGWQRVLYPGPDDAGVNVALGVFRKVEDRLFRVWSWQGHYSWDESVLQEDGTYQYAYENRVLDVTYGSDPSRVMLLSPAGFPAQVTKAEDRIAELLSPPVELPYPMPCAD